MTRLVVIALSLALLTAGPLSSATAGMPCASLHTPAIGAGSGGDTRELRLGLVFYGGVSLAIYMYGQTREVQNLVVASRAHEAETPREIVERDYGGTVLAYYDALHDLEQSSGVKTRVIVDSVAGTSAGGINGVFLAKALAHDLNQDGLRRLWMERADIWKLMGGKAEGKLRLARLGFGLVLPFVKARPPLDGDRMYQWVYDALADMGEGCPGESLVPPGERLRLFVTTTDFRGRPRGFVIGDPATGRESEHRAVFGLTFERDAQGGFAESLKDDPFQSEVNPLLAFAARSTSSFPGAFPPIHLDAMTDILCPNGAPGDPSCPVTPALRSFVHDEVFRDYQLDGSSVDAAWFVDGGVLDNYPFGYVIDDLTSRAPSREVDRRLVYFQPDPAAPPTAYTEEDKAEEIAFLSTIWGALSTIARSEPTGDDFDQIDQFNARVRLASGIIDRVREKQDDQLDELLQLRDKGPVDAAAAREAVEAQLAENAGLPYAAYQELRTLAVVQQLERASSRACRLEESIQRSVLTSAIRRWAEENRLIGDNADTTAQKEMRDSIDVGYLWRQLRFVGEVVNKLYDEVPNEDYALRGELDEAQAALAGRIEQTLRLMRGLDRSPEMEREIGKLCGAALGDYDVDSGFDAAARRFLETNRSTLDAVYAATTEHLGDRQAEIRAGLQGDYDRITADWPPEWRLQVFRNYLGFAMWDLVLYPYQRLTDAGEFQQVRVVRMSPDDTSALGAGLAEDKLGGTRLGHFGAFLRRDRREKDYLWGRLDGAERILSMLYGLEEDASGAQADDAVAEPRTARLRTAFLGILDQEEATEPKLKGAEGCMKELRARLADEHALDAEDPKIPDACRAE